MNDVSKFRRPTVSVRVAPRAERAGTGGADGQACRHYRAKHGQVPPESRGGAPPERSEGSARCVSPHGPRQAKLRLFNLRVRATSPLVFIEFYFRFRRVHKLCVSWCRDWRGRA